MVEKADPIGVRENYLEKNFYGNVTASFDYSKFTRIFDNLSKNRNVLKSCIMLDTMLIFLLGMMENILKINQKLSCKIVADLFN